MRRRWLALAVVAAAGVACSEDGGGDAPGAAGGDASTAAPCDAGDEAWVKQALVALLGRRAEGMREVRALVDLVRATDRAAVARGLMRSPGFVPRWTDRLFDELHVGRLSNALNAACYGVSARPDDAGEVAAFLRDQAPTVAIAGKPPTMADVARSSLLLDDLSVVYRAQLFAMMVRPSFFCPNVPTLDMDLARRRGFGQRFELVYGNRDVDCLPCHNSQFSVTASADPATNRFWPIDGHFEKSVFGDDTGRAALEVYAPFRYRDVVSKASLNDPREAAEYPDDAAPAVSPWGLDPACGQFVPQSAVASDPAGTSAYFTKALGDRASVWDVEATVHTGIDALRGRSTVTAEDVAKLSSDGATAFAYMLATRIASQTWAAAFGEPLVIGHFFPRNAEQRDRLQALTAKLIASGWSLREVLVDVVTDPLFNQRAPSDGCGASPYSLDPVVNPFSRDEPDPTLRGNGVGDELHWSGPRTLASMAAHAAGWAPAEPFGELDWGAVLGAFGDDAVPEEQYPGYVSIALFRMLTKTCRLELDGTSLAAGAYGGKDWVDQLVAAAGTQPTPALRDVVVALKDRVLNEPDIDESLEAPAIAKLFGASGLDASLDSVAGWQDSARRYCGVLLSTRQFSLVGLAPADQTTLPRLIADPATTYRARCDLFAPLVVDPKRATFTCRDDGIDVVTLGAP